MKNYESIRKFVLIAFMFLKRCFRLKKPVNAKAGRISMVENIKSLSTNLKR